MAWSGRRADAGRVGYRSWGGTACCEGVGAAGDRERSRGCGSRRVVCGRKAGCRVVEVFNPGPLPVRLRVSVQGRGLPAGGSGDHVHTDRGAAPGGAVRGRCAVWPRAERARARLRRALDVIGARACADRPRRHGSRRRDAAGLRARRAAVEHPVSRGRSSGTRSAPRVVTVSNPVAHAVAIERIRLGGAFPGNFRVGRQTCVGNAAAGTVVHRARPLHSPVPRVADGDACRSACSRPTSP